MAIAKQTIAHRHISPMRPPRFLAVKILKTESDHFDQFEVGLGLATETPNWGCLPTPQPTNAPPNPNFAKKSPDRPYATRLVDQR